MNLYTLKQGSDSENKEKESGEILEGWIDRSGDC